MGRSLAFAFALAFVLAAGCTRSPVEAIDGNVTPTPASRPTFAAFTIDGPTVLARDGTARPVYEDEGAAIVRYVVRHAPEDTGPDSAFVTFLLDGSVLDTQGVRLKPGEERAFERTIQGLRYGEDRRVEVRVAATSAKATISLAPWPRLGEDLPVGNLTARVDHGARAGEPGRVLVTVSLARAVGDEGTQLRIGLLCRAPGIAPALAAEADDVPLPEPGASSTVDVDSPDCGEGTERYGLELRLDGPAGPATGRILFVPRPG